MEAELRRRLRLELAQARSTAEEGQLDDATLAEIIARAIAAALGWHAESPMHSRSATSSSRNWRPAGGPRGGAGPRDFEDDRPRYDRPRDDRPRDDRPRPPREYDEAPRRPPFRRGPPDYEEPLQDDEFRPRPRGGPPKFQSRGPRPGGFKPGGFKPGGRRPSSGRGGGGGFGPRKPRRNG